MKRLATIAAVSLCVVLAAWAATQSQYLSGNLIVAGQISDAGGTNYLREAPYSTNVYGRQSNSWVVISAGSTSGIPANPNDGGLYARRYTSWEALGNAATMEPGTTLGTVAFGDHNHDIRYPQFGHTHNWTEITNPPDLSVYATNGHVHAGEDITSGTVGTARLGSGTANSSVFLRGDGTWATVTVDPGNTNGLVDAPSDGVFYGRKDAGWVNPTYSDLADGTELVVWDDLAGDITIGGVLTVSGGMVLEGIGSDISTSGTAYRFLMRDPSGNTLRPMTASYARGFIDAAETGHNHDSAYASISHSHAWSDITSGKPTTLSGYGIADGVSTNRAVLTTNSLTGGGDLSANRTLSLVNDSASPGNDRYYGTDSGGTKGFHSFPAVFNPIVFVTTSAVTNSNQDSTYRSILGSVKSGYSATLSGGSLSSGTVLKLSASGVFRGADGHNADLEVRIGSSFRNHFDITEPGSSGPDYGTPWNVELMITVVSSGASATVVASGWMDYHDGTGMFGDYGAGYTIRSKAIVSGTLDTTASNAIDIVYRGVDGNSTDISCTHVICWKY